MNINFSNDNTKGISKTKILKGGFEEMVKQRQKNLPSIEANIQDIFKDYNGEMVAIVRINEDENGDPESSSTLISGVSGFASQVRLTKALDNAVSDLIKTVSLAIVESRGDEGIRELLAVLKQLEDK